MNDSEEEEEGGGEGGREVSTAECRPLGSAPTRERQDVELFLASNPWPLSQHAMRQEGRKQ